jgi:hypothetical protein
LADRERPIVSFLEVQFEASFGTTFVNWRVWGPCIVGGVHTVETSVAWDRSLQVSVRLWSILVGSTSVDTNFGSTSVDFG